MQYAVICEKMDIPMEKRGIRKKMILGEKAMDVRLIFSQQLKLMLECVDCCHKKLDSRSKVMKNISSIFKVLEAFTFFVYKMMNYRILF